MASLPTKPSTKREIVRRRRVEIGNLPTEQQANEFAAVLLASYPAGGKADDGANKVYFRQLRELLRGYPHCVLDQLINPRTGVPGMVEGFPFPSLASVREVADGLVGRRASELERLEAELKDEEEQHQERLYQSRQSPEQRAEQADRAQKLAELMRKNQKALMMDFPHLGPEAFGITPEEHARMRAEAMENLTAANGGRKVMDATVTPMAFVLTVIGGISLQSPEAVQLDACEALKVTYPETTCVDVEPECGKGTGVKCLGRADLEPRATVRKKATAKKRTPTRSRTARYRRSSHRPVAVSSLVKAAF